MNKTNTTGMVNINRNEFKKTQNEKDILKAAKSQYKHNLNKERFKNERNMLIEAILKEPIPNWGNIILKVR